LLRNRVTGCVENIFVIYPNGSIFPANFPLSILPPKYWCHATHPT
jgi:hypothetical protein